MTEPHAPAIDPLEPWPDAVEWRAVSPKLINVELIGLATWIVVLLAGLLVGWLLNGHWLWPAGMAAVLIFAGWRAIVTVRAVKA